MLREKKSGSLVVTRCALVLPPSVVVAGVGRRDCAFELGLSQGVEKKGTGRAARKAAHPEKERCVGLNSPRTPFAVRSSLVACCFNEGPQRLI